MITIKNTQRRIPINKEQIKADVAAILQHLDYADFDIGILITTNNTMQYYNKQFRGIDKATDILSFPTYPDLKPGQRIKAIDDDATNLGDLIIAPSYVQDTLAQWGQTFEQRLRILLVHGVCHLLGYDHVTEKEYKQMQRKEKQLLKALEDR